MKNVEKKLEAFKRASRELAEAWEQAEQESGKTIEVLEKAYPFEKDFMEIMYDISQWGNKE